MGIIASTIAGINLCTSRLVNWVLCAVALSGIMTFMHISVIYGMTIGYHTGQEQLADFAGKQRSVKSTTKFQGPLLRAHTDVERRSEPYGASATSAPESPQRTSTDSMLGLELYETRPPKASSRDENETPVFIQYVDMTTLESIPDFEDYPRKYSGRVRRAKNDILSKTFWRPYKKTDIRQVLPDKNR